MSSKCNLFPKISNISCKTYSSIEYGLQAEDDDEEDEEEEDEREKPPA
jgi:hypothetical protein